MTYCEDDYTVAHYNIQHEEEKRNMKREVGYVYRRLGTLCNVWESLQGVANVRFNEWELKKSSCPSLSFTICVTPVPLIYQTPNLDNLPRGE